MATSSATKSRTKSTIFDSIHTPKTLTPKSTGPNSATISSSFFKSVYMEDWWLMKVQDKGLAVGGYSCSEMQGIRLFCSAAIAKRQDATTLDTTDGFTISISGYINRSRTRENGFPSEVCNRFQLGFPYDWEEYGCVPHKHSASDEFSMSSGDEGNSFLPASLDDIPLTRTRDLIMSTLDDSGNSALTKAIFDDVLEKLGGKSIRNTENSIHSKMDGSGLNVDPARDDTSYNQKAKVNKKWKDRNVILNATYMRTEQYQNSTSQSKMGMDVFTVNRGVSTRSMAKRMSSRNNQEENLSVNTKARKGISDMSSSSKAAGNQQEARVTRSSSNTSHATNLFK